MDRVVAKMIETPSLERMQSFYEALKKAGVGKGLEVKDVGANKGKGIFASRNFAEGEAVLVEPPLVAAQDTTNKADALVCAHCFQYVGSIELQIGRRLATSAGQSERNSKAAGELRSAKENGVENEEDDETDGLRNEPDGSEDDDTENEDKPGRLESGKEGGLADKDGSEARGLELDTGDAGLERLGSGGAGCCEDDEDEEERVPPPPETIAALLEGSLKLPLSKHYSLPAIVECLGGCSENVYCTHKCARASWGAHHRLLCTGGKSEAAGVEALRGFKAFADGSNNIFHVAAQVVAATVLRAKRGGGTKVPEHLLGVFDSAVESECTTEAGSRLERNQGRVLGSAEPTLMSESDRRKIKEQQLRAPQSAPFSHSNTQPQDNVETDGSFANTSRASRGELDSTGEALLRAWEPFSMGWKGVWWESMACPPEMADAPEEEAAFRESIKELCEGSLQLLRAAFGQEAEAFGPLFSLEVYSRIIGMFELNNLALVVQSPVENYFLAIDELPEEEKRKVEPVTKPLLDALGRSYATHCEGTAFYTLQSCANHSCAPNARAFKREEDINGHAVLLASQDIEAGEEVTISYIDETEDYKIRQSALEDYGFVCQCPRCMDDSNSQA